MIYTDPVTGLPHCRACQDDPTELCRTHRASVWRALNGFDLYHASPDGSASSRPMSVGHQVGRPEQQGAWKRKKAPVTA